MIKILHLADLHLGRSHRYLGSKAPERQKEADGILRRVVDYVLKEREDVGVIAISGDLFETYHPGKKLVGEVIGSLRDLVNAGKTVLTLPGNHDEISYHGCVYRTHGGRWPGVLVTSPEWTRVATVRSEDGPCHFYGIAYQAGVSPEVFNTSIPLESDGLHVALLHASVDLPSTDRSIHASSKDLAKLGVNYVALGHIHKPDKIKISHGLAVYPGLLEGGDFDDPGGARLTVVDLGSGVPVIEEVPFETRRIEREHIDLGAIEDEDVLRSRISSRADAGLILRACLTGAAGFEPPSSTILGELEEHFYHLEVEDDYALVSAVDVESAAGEETVLGLVIRNLQERESKAETEDEKAMVRLALRHAWRAFRGRHIHE